MLKLKVDVRVTDEKWAVVSEASATTDVAEHTATSLSYYVRMVASALGDAVAAEVVKHLGLPPTKEHGDDDAGE